MRGRNTKRSCEWKSDGSRKSLIYFKVRASTRPRDPIEMTVEPRQSSLNVKINEKRSHKKVMHFESCQNTSWQRLSVKYCTFPALCRVSALEKQGKRTCINRWWTFSRSNQCRARSWRTPISAGETYCKLWKIWHKTSGRRTYAVVFRMWRTKLLWTFVLKTWSLRHSF